jgi:hypothetical protein
MPLARQGWRCHLPWKYRLSPFDRLEKFSNLSSYLTTASISSTSVQQLQDIAN